MTTAVTGEHHASVQRIQLRISGMSCSACAHRVESTLNKLPGVRAAVNFGTRVATIDTSEAVDAAALCQAVRRAGYQADLCTDDGRSASDPDADHARQLLIRLAIAAVLFVPVADLSVMFGVVPATRFTGWQWVLSALALPVVTWAAWPFHRVAMRNARHHAASMETLISVGITAATIWSLYTVFGNHSPIERSGIWQALLGSDAIYFEVAAGVTVFVLVGRYFEARAKSQAGSALRALAALSAKEVAVLLPDGSEMVIPADELKEQQRFVVRPGQIVAADGLAVDGSAAVDMSAMTGEAKPTRVRPGGQVIGGTTVLDGRLIVEAAAVGADTQFAGMVRLVEQAQAQKADAQRLADRISSVFVPAVLVIAALTAAGWLIAGGQPDRAVSAALAVLVIACPCALGLATPTAMMVASGRGAQLGIFLKGYKSLEATRAVDTVVFDKTGTLTTGRLRQPVGFCSTTSSTGRPVRSRTRPSGRCRTTGRPSRTRWALTGPSFLGSTATVDRTCSSTATPISCCALPERATGISVAWSTACGGVASGPPGRPGSSSTAWLRACGPPGGCPMTILVAAAKST